MRTGNGGMETYSSTQQIVELSTTESIHLDHEGTSITLCSAMVGFRMTLNVVCETDASAGRAMATRRGVGCVRHLDTRLLWLQQLCAERVVQVRVKTGEHNKADLGIKMVDLR